MKSFFYFIAFLSLSLIAYADSDVNIVLIKGGAHLISVAVVPFSGDVEKASSVIQNDLKLTNQFQLDEAALPETPHQIPEVHQAQWASIGVDNLVIGSMTPVENNKLKVSFVLLDEVKGTKSSILLEKTYVIPVSQTHALMNHIADLIYQKLTGVRGIFSTRIAHIQKDHDTYSLIVMDFNGANPSAIVTSSEPLMSPAWSPNGKKLAYVSLEGGQSKIYVIDVASGKRQLVIAATGINGAPAFSPDGQKLAVVLSKSGTPKIYVLHLQTKQLTQITNGNFIDTEPSFSSDGRSIIFTSDRSTRPHIYRVALTGGVPERLTFSGEYNTTASFSPDGKQIVMVNRSQGNYNIATQYLENEAFMLRTHSGRANSPSWAANGAFIVAANEDGTLDLISVGAGVISMPWKHIMHAAQPACSPFL